MLTGKESQHQLNSAGISSMFVTVGDSTSSLNKTGDDRGKGSPAIRKFLGC